MRWVFCCLTQAWRHVRLGGNESQLNGETFTHPLCLRRKEMLVLNVLETCSRERRVNGNDLVQFSLQILLNRRAETPLHFLEKSLLEC